MEQTPSLPSIDHSQIHYWDFVFLILQCNVQKKRTARSSRVAILCCMIMKIAHLSHQKSFSSTYIQLLDSKNLQKAQICREMQKMAGSRWDSGPSRLHICHQVFIIHTSVPSGGKLELIVSEHIDPQLSHREGHLDTTPAFVCQPHLLSILLINTGQNLRRFFIGSFICQGEAFPKEKSPKGLLCYTPCCLLACAVQEIMRLNCDSTWLFYCL